MRDKVNVEFWIDDSILYLKNSKTEQVRMTKNQKQIAMFLNAHNLTINDVKGVMRGYDVLNLFGKQRVFSPFSFVRL